MKAFVTGGTGLLGSRIAEQLAYRGDQVVALVRPGSDTRFLEPIGTRLIAGALDDREIRPTTPLKNGFKL
jgi:uncharacterized protein YbjT (DUF2867 family)